MFEKHLQSRWFIILTGTLIVAAPLLGLALFVYVDITGELEKISIEKRQSLAYTAAHMLSEKLRSEISFGNAYANNSLLIQGIIKGDLKMMRLQAQNLIETSHSIERVFITSPKGILLAGYPSAPQLVGKDLSEFDWYRGVTRSWTPYISQFYLRLSPPRRNIFSISLPIRTTGGDIIGILVMQPGQDFIKNATDGIKNASGTTYVVDSKGIIIYHPRVSEDKPVNISGSPFVQKVIKGEEGYEKSLDPLNGKTVISAYNAVAISGWGVITERRLDEVLAPVKKITRSIYLFSGIMLLIGSWFAYRRSALINKLNATANELEQSIEEQQALNENLRQATKSSRVSRRNCLKATGSSWRRANGPSRRWIA